MRVILDSEQTQKKLEALAVEALAAAAGDPVEAGHVLRGALVGGDPALLAELRDALLNFAVQDLIERAVRRAFYRKGGN